MKAIQFDSLSQIKRDLWNGIVGTEYPFLRHEFLSALERCGPASIQTGWQPQHILIYDEDEAIAAMPLYLKFHSRGEFVFDHRWAAAYQHYGLAYYPKLLTAIPFTPCHGKRIAVKTGVDETQVISFITAYIKHRLAASSISSWHCLFPSLQTAECLVKEGQKLRMGVQYHWFNACYRDFDDYLERFSSAKRKQVKRERRRVAEQNIEFQSIFGKDITEHDWEVFFKFYRMTYLKNGMPPYLNLEFFRELAETMPESLLLIAALKNGVYKGMALNFIGANTLYGRYWGCEEDYHSLHFETCYYQGLDFCLKQNLQRFDSGAQGEHKIARGFEPVYTYSTHWIEHPSFAAAIDDFLKWEMGEVRSYREFALDRLPFKKQSDC